MRCCLLPQHMSSHFGFKLPVIDAYASHCVEQSADMTHLILKVTQITCEVNTFLSILEVKHLDQIAQLFSMREWT